jgi:hypothetical protein
MRGFPSDKSPALVLSLPERSPVSKKPKVVASYGYPKKPKRWPAKRIRWEFAKEILEADRAPPEASFSNFEDMMAWLDDGPLEG